MPKFSRHIAKAQPKKAEQPEQQQDDHDDDHHNSPGNGGTMILDAVAKAE